MSKSYSQIQKEIEALKRHAEKLRAQEIAEVIARIKEAISTYGLTAADLGLGTQRKESSRGKVVAKKAGAKGGVVKYRDSEGNTWGGRGPRPLWLREALNAGRSLEDFVV